MTVFTLLNNLPWFWLAVMVVCLAIEGLTFSLTTIWFACGALVTIFVSMAPVSFRWQMAVFVVISCILLILTRPLAVRRFRQHKQPRTNADAIVGMEGVVVKTVTPIEKGELKCDGKIWTAQSSDGSEIPSGTVCRVLGLHGNTVQIAPLHSKTAVSDSRENS